MGGNRWRNVRVTYAVLESCVIQMIYNGIGLSLESGPMCKECRQNGVREKAVGVERWDMLRVWYP